MPDGAETVTLIGFGAVPATGKEPPVQPPPTSELQVTFTIASKPSMGWALRPIVTVPPGGTQSVAAFGGCKVKSMIFRVNPAEAVSGPLTTPTVNG